MPAKVVLIDLASGKPLHIEDYNQEGTEEKILLVTTIPEHYGLFNNEKITAQGTYRLATPDGGGSIQVTDLIVNFEKKNTSTVEVRFNDGTRSETLFYADLTDGNVNIATNIRGHMQGWKDAYVEVVEAVADADGSVTVCYVKNPQAATLEYPDWDARR